MLSWKGKTSLYSVLSRYMGPELVEMNGVDLTNKDYQNMTSIETHQTNTLTAVLFF